MVIIKNGCTRKTQGNPAKLPRLFRVSMPLLFDYRCPWLICALWGKARDNIDKGFGFAGKERYRFPFFLQNLQSFYLVCYFISIKTKRCNTNNPGHCEFSDDCFRRDPSCPPFELEIKIEYFNV